MSGAGGATVLFHLIHPDYEMELFQGSLTLFSITVVYYSSASAQHVAPVCQPCRMAAAYGFKPATVGD